MRVNAHIEPEYRDGNNGNNWIIVVNGVGLERQPREELSFEEFVDRFGKNELAEQVCAKRQQVEAHIAISERELGTLMQISARLAFYKEVSDRRDIW
jgi:hypothetical protein